MALLASTLISAARAILLDPSPGVTWLDARLLYLLNAAERATCLVKFDAYPVRGPVPLAAGTKQTLPTGATGLIDVYGNTVSGRSITKTNRDLQTVVDTYFPAATPEVDAKHYTYDVRDPTHFEVVPPNDGTGSLDVLYGMTPTAIATTGSAINLPDTYESALIAHLLSDAYAENTDRQDLVKSEKYLSQWKVLVGLREASITGSKAPKTEEA